jgi:hypothetical protein
MQLREELLVDQVDGVLLEVVEDLLEDLEEVVGLVCLLVVVGVVELHLVAEGVEVVHLLLQVVEEVEERLCLVEEEEVVHPNLGEVEVVVRLNLGEEEVVVHLNLVLNLQVRLLISFLSQPIYF